VFGREIAGFGASGRNGGWCSALFPAALGKLARMADRIEARTGRTARSAALSARLIGG
jgi:hypothetical protein